MRRQRRPHSPKFKAKVALAAIQGGAGYELDKDGSRWLEGLLEQHLLDGGLLVMSAHHEVGLPAHLLNRLRLGS